MWNTVKIGANVSAEKTKQQDGRKSVAKSGSQWEQLTLELHVSLLKSPSPVALALRWWFPVGSSQPFWRRDVLSPFVLRGILDTASLFQFDCWPQAVMGGTGASQYWGDSLEWCSSFGWISAGNNNIWFLGPLLLVRNHCDGICRFEPVSNTVFLFCVTGQVMCLLGVNE